jgi:hypothetical protein
MLGFFLSVVFEILCATVLFPFGHIAAMMMCQGGFELRLNHILVARK